MRLQQKNARKEQVGPAGRQGLHARPQRRQCPHGRTVTARPPRSSSARAIARLILKEDPKSPKEQGEIGPAGDDAAAGPGSFIGHEGMDGDHHVEARPEAVLDVLTDPEACARWAPIPFDVEDLRTPRLRCGSRARVSGRLAGSASASTCRSTRPSTAACA